jgi:Type I phosphodiesterase / nucleotide pyrophosphatase
MSAHLGPAAISRSIFASLGTEEDNPLDIANSSGAEVLLLIDGFGSFIFEMYAEAIPTMVSLSGSHHSGSHHLELTSHFPSTTVTNLTSLGTGVLPSRHGMVGYTMRIPFATEGTEQLLNGLKWDPRIDPVTWQREPTLFERATSHGVAVSHIASKRYQGSGFTEAALRGARYLPAQSDDEILSALQESTRSRSSFTYLYLNDVDEAGHGHGVGSEKWIAALLRVDLLVQKIVASLPAGARLWITADHGMINAGEKVVLGEGNQLLDGVALLGGEPRARHLYLRDGLSADLRSEEREQVVKRWRDFFGDRIELLSPEEAYGNEIQGDFLGRIGDVIAVPNDATILVESARKEPQLRMVGHHGAMTEVESRIPLRVVEA